MEISNDYVNLRVPDTFFVNLTCTWASNCTYAYLSQLLFSSDWLTTRTKLQGQFRANITKILLAKPPNTIGKGLYCSNGKSGVKCALVCVGRVDDGMTSNRGCGHDQYRRTRITTKVKLTTKGQDFSSIYYDWDNLNRYVDWQCAYDTCNTDSIAFSLYNAATQYEDQKLFPDLRTILIDDIFKTTVTKSTVWKTTKTRKSTLTTTTMRSTTTSLIEFFKTTTSFIYNRLYCPTGSGKIDITNMTAALDSIALSYSTLPARSACAVSLIILLENSKQSYPTATVSLNIM